MVSEWIGAQHLQVYLVKIITKRTICLWTMKGKSKQNKSYTPQFKDVKGCKLKNIKNKQLQT